MSFTDVITLLKPRLICYSMMFKMSQLLFGTSQSQSIQVLSSTVLQQCQVTFFFYTEYHIPIVKANGEFNVPVAFWPLRTEFTSSQYLSLVL